MSETCYFPAMTGTEEETRINIFRPGANNQAATKPRPLEDKDLEALHRAIDEFCPTLPGSNEFRRNGSKTYSDGGGVELCTPELNNPYDQYIYAEANAALLVSGLTSYLQYRSTRSRQRLVAVLNRRVIDSSDAMNTWGCHDNFSLAGNEYRKLMSKPDDAAGHLWVGHLYSRGFITGAAQIGRRYSSFSQKMAVPNKYEGYGNINTLHRIDNDHGPRLEIRCNDINLKAWAFISRVGGSALVLAASQSTLAKELANSAIFKFDQPDLAWNVMPLRRNGNLYAGRSLLRTIDMQRHLVGTVLEKLEDHIGQPIPLAYRQIGQQILDYCDDVESVAYGKKEIDLLCDRADWAEKLRVIRAHMRRSDSRRRIGDAQSQALDLMYDQIKVEATPGSQPVITYGYGHKLAAAHGDQASRQTAIECARHYPPVGTRATVRVNAAMRLGKSVTKCDWHKIEAMQDKKKKSFSLNRLPPYKPQLSHVS